MNEEKKKPVESGEDQEKEVNHTKENLEAVGQMILGEVEKIGGIITADPLAQAEGDYNVEIGSLHQETNKELAVGDQDEEVEEKK